MLRQTTALILCVALLASGCASAGGPRTADAPAAPVMDQSVLADYVQRLPAGTRVRVERSNGQMFKGTLMKATPDGIVVQKNTRVPEAPIEVPLDRVARVTIETNGSSVGKTVALGVGTGVAVTFGIFAVLAVIFGGD